MSMFPCPCCGYVVLPEPPGSYDICAICFWEDDALQLEFATTLSGGANSPTLLDAQRNYAVFGACEQRFVTNVRAPEGGTLREPDWRPIDPARDQFPEWGECHDRAPAVDDSLYYWRDSFWRRKRAE